jgi:hypothetical protein
MTGARLGGLLWFLLGSAIFVLLGVAWERHSALSMVDFKSVYYGARCLLEGSDPYQEGELLRVYQAEGGDRPTDPAVHRLVVTLYVNLPTGFLLIAPFAALPWGPAHVLWMFVTAASFLLAAYLMWNLAARDAPVISGALICLFLFGSELLLEVGNTAGIAVSLCVIAVWCFVKERFVPAGVLCFALSLAVKPHDAGLVWLYFLLAGGFYRKRALQTLALTAVLCLLAILWVSHVAPHWPAELQTNLQAISAHGGLNDPGPDTIVPRSHGSSVVSMQTVFSVFWDEPHFYNIAAYLLCGPFLLIWALSTFRNRFSQERAWLALASIAALSMLPIYHRQHDTRLLLLTFPAFAMLWAKGGASKWMALLFTGLGVLLTGDTPLQLLAILANHIGASTESFSGKVLTIVLGRPAPLIMLVMGIFYLWAYLRRTSAPAGRLVGRHGARSW